MRLIFRTGKKIIPLFFLLIFLGVCLLLFFNADQITEKAKTTLIQVLEKQLGEEIQIGKVTLFPLNRITIHQVKVNLGQEKFFQAERVIVSFYLQDLLQGVEGLVKGIREVQLVRPEVFLVKKEDGFGFEKFLEQGEEKSESTLELNTTIRISGGRVHYSDEMITETLHNLNGHVRIVGEEIDLKLESQVEGLKSARIEVAATVNPQMEFAIKFSDLPFEQITNYGIALPSEIEDLKGKGTGSLQIGIDQTGEIIYSGRVTLSDGEIKLSQPQLAVEEIKGSLSFNSQRIVVDDLQGRTTVGQVGIKGQVNNLANPNLALTITTTGIELGEILSLVPGIGEEELAGKMVGSVEINGNWQDPLIRGSLNFPKLTYQDLHLENIKTNWRYQNSFLTLRDFEVHLGEGNIKGANGYIGFNNPERITYSLNLDVVDLDFYQILSNIPMPFDGEVPQGLLSGKVYLSGEGFDPDNITAIGFIDIKKGRYMEMPIDNLKANFWLTSGELGLSKAEIHSPYLSTVLTGFVALKGDVELRVEPSFINLSWFGERFDFPLDGKGMIQGEIRGPLLDPHFVGDVKFEHGQIWDQGFDQIAGRINLNLTEAVLSETSLIKGESDLRLSGRVGFAAQDMDVEVDILHSSLTAVQEILDFVEIPFELTGDIKGRVLLAGSWFAPKVEGQIKAEKGVVLDQPYNLAEVSFRWSDNDIQFNNFKVSYQNTVLQATGVIKDYSILDIEMVGQRFDLTDIQLLRDKLPQITGKANFRGTLTGEVTSPSFWGTISSDAIQFNGNPIEMLSALLQFNDGVLTIRPMKMINEGSEYTLLGEIRFDDMTMELEIRNRQAFVSDLLRFTDLPVKDLSYVLGGEIWIRGDLNNPKIELNATLTDGDKGVMVLTGIYDLDHGMDMVLKGTRFDLNPLRAYLPFDEFRYTLDGEAIVSGKLENPVADLKVILTDLTNGKLAVTGVYDLNKGLDLDLIASRFDLVPFKSFIPFDQEYTGKINLQGSLKGQFDQLSANLDLELVEVSFNNYYLQSLGGSVQLVNSATLKLDQEMVLPDGNQIRFHGAVSVNDPKGPLDLTIDMKRGNLEILALLVPGVERAGGGGEGVIKLGGTLEQPLIEGKITLASGFVQYTGLELIRDIKGQIVLRPGRITLDGLEARYGNGRVGVQGWMSLDGFMPENIDLAIKTKDFHFVYGSIDAHGDADVKITGPVFAPEIRGPILVHNAEVGVIPFYWPMPEPSDEPSAFSFAPTIYLELYPGDNVRATGGSPINMSVVVSKSNTDKLVIDTTSGELILSGDLYTRNGTFNIYNSNFRVTRGSASFVKFNKYIPIIRMQAQTTVNNHRIFVDLDGLPTDIMKMNLYSEPALSEVQIIALLANQGGLGELIDGSGNVTDVISEEIWRFISQGLRNEFLNKLEASVEKALGLDTFRLDPILLGDTRVNLQIGKYLEDNFYVIYNRTFSQNPEQSIGFEYHIRPNVGLEGSFKGVGDYQVGLKANLPF